MFGMSLQEFLEASKRILMVSKKPDAKEYATMVKVTGIGIILIGIIGFLISLVFLFLGLKA